MLEHKMQENRMRIHREQRARFLWPPEVGRPMKLDEEFLVVRLWRHVSVCYHCNKFIRQQDLATLCRQGHEFLAALTMEMQSNGGKVYSRARNERRVRVEVPAYSINLFKAIEDAESRPTLGRSLPPPSPVRRADDRSR